MSPARDSEFKSRVTHVRNIRPEIQTPDNCMLMRVEGTIAKGPFKYGFAILNMQ